MRDRRPWPYLFGALLSTLFGVYVGHQIQSGIGTVIGAFVSTLLWGFLAQLYADVRQRVSGGRLVRLESAAGAARVALLGLGYLALGAAPLLGESIGSDGGDVTVALAWPWAIYTCAYWVARTAEDGFLPGSYEGPFSFLFGVLAAAVGIVILFISGLLLGLLACGLAAGISAGVSWLEYAGYLSAVCGAMLTLGLWFPGKATTGFHEALPILLGIIFAGVPVGWIAYFVATG